MSPESWKSRSCPKCQSKDYVFAIGRRWRRTVRSMTLRTSWFRSSYTRKFENVATHHNATSVSHAQATMTSCASQCFDLDEPNSESVHNTNRPLPECVSFWVSYDGRETEFEELEHANPNRESRSLRHTSRGYHGGKHPGKLRPPPPAPLRLKEAAVNAPPPLPRLLGWPGRHFTRTSRSVTSRLLPCRKSILRSRLR